MPRYRLGADPDRPVEEFDAADLDAAMVHARALAVDRSTVTGYWLEELFDGRWVLRRAWLPRRIRIVPGGAGTTTAPPPPA